MRNDIKYWLVLNFGFRLGSRAFQILAQNFLDFREIWQPKSHLRGGNAGLTGKQIEIIKNLQEKINPDKELDKLEKLKLFGKYPVRVVTFLDNGYPELLKDLPDKPAMLYVCGELESDSLNVSVIGSRRYTSYGRRTTEFLIKPLAECGITIVSGLALGIDSIAHLETIKNKGKTIAIPGSSLDKIYPAQNTRIAREILESGGVLISEFPLGMPIVKSNFPIRNRIIAGISKGLVVIEAAEKSGALITAHQALEYNREVFAVPGDIFSSNSAGANNLIKLGAKPVAKPDDILEELNIKYAEKRKESYAPKSAEEKKILDCLSGEPIHIDEISQKTGIDIALLGSLLIKMEIEGVISNIGGGKYIQK